MAWLIGLVDQEELQELKRRGWKNEADQPEVAEAVKGLFGDTPAEMGETVAALFVEQDISRIMSGPDWHQEDVADPVLKAASRQLRLIRALVKDGGYTAATYSEIDLHTWALQRILNGCRNPQTLAALVLSSNSIEFKRQY